MTEHKLESGVNWQEVSKQKGIQQMGTKQGLRFPRSTVTAKMCDTVAIPTELPSPRVCVCVCNVGVPECEVYTNFSGTLHIDVCSVQTASYYIYFWNDISCLMLSLLLCLFCLHENRTWIQQK